MTKLTVLPDTIHRSAFHYGFMWTKTQKHEFWVGNVVFFKTPNITNSDISPMCSKEFAFCNKILYTHHHYLPHSHQNVQLSTVSYKTNTHTHKTHTHTQFPKNCYVRNMFYSVFLVKAKYDGTVKDLQT